MPGLRRDPVVGAWTGEKLLFWGGITHEPGEAPRDLSADYPPGYPGYIGNPAVDGMAFDPASGSWEALPPAPVPFLGFDVSAAWTGRELLVWGADVATLDGSNRARSVGALYDPEAQRWRRMSDQDHVALGRGVWNGKAFVVVGLTRGSPSKVVASAYDPDGDRWETLSPPPVLNYPMAFNALGSDGRGRVFTTDDLSMPAVLIWQAGASAWRPTVPSPFADRRDSIFMWTGTHLLQLGGEGPSGRSGPFDDTVEDEPGMAVYDAAKDRWRLAADPPEPRLGGGVAADGRIVFVSGPGGGSRIYDPARDEWSSIPSPPGMGTTVWAEGQLWVLDHDDYPPQPEQTAVLFRYEQ